MSRYCLTLVPQALPGDYPGLLPGMVGYHVEVRDQVEDEEVHLGFIGPMDLLPAPSSTPAFDRLVSWLAHAVSQEIEQAHDEARDEDADFLEAAFQAPGPVLFLPDATVALAQDQPEAPGAVVMERWPSAGDPRVLGGFARTEAEARKLDVALESAQVPALPKARM